MRVPRVLVARRAIQWLMMALVVVIGAQFTLWVRAHLAGRWPTVARPPGVEGFLPIDGMLGARHLLHTGQVDPIHPAAVAVFLGICLMSALVAKSFCSHLCPVGLVSPLYTHVGGMAMQEPSSSDRVAAVPAHR